MHPPSPKLAPKAPPEPTQARTGLREECGVVGVWAPNQDLAPLVYRGLHALQHRGEESAGMLSFDKDFLYRFRGMGRVAQVFDEWALDGLFGSHAIGHTRYSTSGQSKLGQAQPLLALEPAPVAIAHNGNLTNTAQLGHHEQCSAESDSALILQLLSHGGRDPQGAHQARWDRLTRPLEKHPEIDWPQRLRAFMQQARGAFSLVVATAEALYALRDPLGFRPLCLGALDAGYALASESCALKAMGAKVLREVAPGELLRIDAQGLTTLAQMAAPAPALCVFEWIYLARPDSELRGHSIHRMRQGLGAQLWREAPVDADLVVPIPQSAVAAALGLARAAALPYDEGLVKGNYPGRTFIQPNQALRQQGVRQKYNAVEAILRDRRVVLVDDSIVRGTTVGPLVKLLRDSGAREVHVRIAAPPLRFPCYMGVDINAQEELISARLSPDELCEAIEADSLAFLSLDGLWQVLGREGQHCGACFSGRYPQALEANNPMTAEKRARR